MRGRYICSDPLDTVSRVIDTARRMELRFSQLKFEARDGGVFALSFSVDETNEQLMNTFAQRIRLFVDLTEEKIDD